MGEAFGQTAIGEICRHICDELVPKRIAQARVDRLSAIHREFARFRRDDEEHGVRVGIFVQTCSLEMCARMIQRVGHAALRDVHADSPGCSFFRAADRRANAVTVDRFHGNVTCGAFCAPAAAWKYDLSLNRWPNKPAYNTVGNVFLRVLKARAASLYRRRSTAIRFSVPSSCVCSVRKFSFALSCG